MSEIDLIRRFVASNIDGGSLSDDEDFFAAGLVSSMFVLQIVLFVEKAFSITVSGTDLKFDSFRTIHAIADFVRAKQAD